MNASNFFTAGGALPPDSPSYVERPADNELFNAVLAGQFCYVLADHHMGKSSLMFRTAWRLQQQDIRPAIIDLSGINPRASLEQAYLVLVKRLKYELKLPLDPDTWWAEQDSLDAEQRFTTFLHGIILAEIEQPVVVFVDGVNQYTNFWASFAAVIQSIYNARTTDSTYNRLTFVLLGMSTLANLTRNGNRSLFKAEHRIDLHEFSREEAQSLLQGLQTKTLDQAQTIFNRIYYWTHGHPYLTQKLCLTTAKMWHENWTSEHIDLLVENLFIFAGIDEDPNLQFIEDSIKTSPRPHELLSLYRKVYRGKEVATNEQSLQQGKLRLIGLVGGQNGTLQIRNEIYRYVFNLDWIRATTPIKWKRNIAIAVMAIALLVTGVAGFFIQQQRQRADQAQVLTNNFKNATSAEERLVNLAGLFYIPGYEDQARQLFYENLGADDQLNLFAVADPSAVGEQIITVVGGLYTDSTLEKEQQNVLLEAMAQPLNQLQNSPSLGAIELELEINQWLKGRELHYTEGLYQRAVDAYSVAIRVNQHNPGPYFDRGLAYAALGSQNQALADFVAVLRLDESWQPRIQQALIDDPQLYLALWGEQNELGDLIALVPTPTNTPTPTVTPTPSPLPTITPTPLPPTATPTPTPTSTATPTPSPTSTVPSRPTATPTPNNPTGTITLLNPDLSDNDPSYGPTNFEWQWAGNLPPEFGFEIRVWKEGDSPAGVHNSVLDNQNGNIKNIGGNTYRLSTDIKDAAGIRGSGVYLWTVALVRINPNYEDLGQQAVAGEFRFAAPGVPGSSDDKGDSGGGSSGGGGGVGIQ